MNPGRASLPPLLSGERILWRGQPQGGIILRPIEIVLIPFSLLWGGFALFWNVNVWSADTPLDFKLFGLPFVLAGLYVTVGRFFVDLWLRRHLHYAVTDRRILIRRTVIPSTRSIDLKRLPELEFEERADGSGTIGFGRTASWQGNGLGIWSPAIGAGTQFLRIDDVRKVYELILGQTD